MNKNKLFTLIASITLSLTSLAQAPEAFKYQAVVRDAAGNILGTQAVGIRLSVIQGSPTGTAVYTETFAAATNNYGLVNLEIGMGITIDDFTLINWANGPYYMNTSVDVTGGTSYVDMGTSQLLSVPYALYAKTAESSAIDLVDDADSDPTNELQDWSNLPNIPAGFADDIDNVDDADADPANEIQDISLNSNNLSISSGSTVDLSAYLDNTDAQTLSYASPTLSISNGNSVILPDGDITDVTAGDGLSGGGTSGAVTITANADNGLNVDATADAIQLGGALTENTTIDQGTYNMIFDLTNSGDFQVQDAGVNHFEVRDNGLSFFGDDTYWNDGSTSGITLAAIIDDVDDGRFMIYENGVISVDLDANTQFVFNEQGLDRNFRVESALGQNALFVDAGLDRIGIGTNAPIAKLQVVGGVIMPEPGLASGIHWPANYYGGGGDDPYIAYISQVGENTTLQIANTNDWDDDISFYQNNAERMVIYNGNVGIGTSTPAFQLDVSTNSAAKPLSSAWTVPSDRRLKKDIRPYTSGLQDIMKINPVWFTYTGKAGMQQATGVGIIAQELQEIAPYMVNPWSYREKDGTSTEYLGVDNGAMTYMLINAVQEQQEIIQSQENELNEIKEMLLKLQRQVDAMEKK